MKNITKLWALLFTTFIFLVSCNNLSSDHKKDTTGTSQKEYTVTYDSNIPSDDGEVWFTCSENSPASEKVMDGESIILPAFIGELSKYIGNDKEGVYTFEKWNTKSDGTGDFYTAGTSYKVNADITFYAVYSTEKKDTGSSDSVPEGEYLDLSLVSEYEMKVGDRIQLYVENADFFTVTSGDDVVTIDSSNVMEAIGAGNATIQVFIKNSVRTYSLVVTVIADSSDSNHNAALLGKWVYGESYLQFNADGSGYLFYKNGSYTTLDTTCTWNTSTGGGKNWLNISDSNPGSSDGSYEYTVSTTTLRIHGRLAFGIPMDTEWNKQ